MNTNESIFKGDNLEKLKQKHDELQKRIDETFEKKDPLSFENVARLCYGDVLFEKHLARNN